MKKLILSVLIVAMSFAGLAQNDAKAEEILKSLEQEFDGTQLIGINFSMVLFNIEANLRQTKNGQLILSNDQFDLEMENIQILCDGKTKWTVLKEDEMIQISNIEEDEEEVFNLGDYFKGYKDKFNYTMLPSTAPIQIVELSPLDTTLETVKITVHYNKTMKRITQITEQNKEGTQTIFNILSYEKKELGSHNFSLDLALFSDFEIDDLR